jgi:Calx-beta domain-containing protein
MNIGSDVRFLKPLGFLVLFLVSAFVSILFPREARAQTGNVAFSQSVYTAVVSQTNAVITVNFSGSADPATVDYMTSDGTAVNGVDYTGVSNTLFFAAGSLTASFNITLLNNPAAAPTQTVNLALLNPSGSAVAGSPSNAVLEIINNLMQQLQFSQTAYSVDDTDTVATITIVRVGATNGAVAVNFSTSDGSARAGVDYTMTTGTVQFADGVISNTVTIPILPPPSLLETNQTVNLTLTAPTGGATLGNPVHAQLTIVATGPQVMQLTSATYAFHEHVGRATVTAIRFGNSSTQDSVNYATSDGTASNGVDYFSTSGTLVFAPGVARSSFSFSFVEFKTFQSNKTVNVTLSNPVGGPLGTPSTAVVTIVNDKPQTITFTNSGGGVVTLLLKSAGTMAPSNLEPLTLVLDATDSGTTLTMKVKKAKGGGTGTLQIDQITGDGACRLIDAGDFDIVGAGIQLGDYLKQLKIHDLLNGAGIVANGSENQNTSITAHNLDDGCAIELGSRLSKLSAARFGDGAAIVAPAIGNISIKGDKRNGIAGDFRGSITASGDGIATNQNALGKLAVSGVISNVSIAIANGGVGAISAFQMLDSTVFVGYVPTDPSNPLASGTFVPGLRLSSVSIRSIANGFVNSDLAASAVGTVNLSSVPTDNGGIIFGVLASQHVGSVTVKTPKFRWMPNGADDQSLGDFHVIQ